MNDDPIHELCGPEVRWSRNNSAEAGPGVLTPLAWAFFGRLTEVSCRQGFHDLGLIPRSQLAYPTRVDDRMLGIFHGRWALNAGVVRGIMGALPGVSGDDVERDMLGHPPEVHVDDPPPWRAPVILVKAPVRLLATGRDSTVLSDQMRSAWAARVGAQGPRAGVPARALLKEAMDGFGRALRLQAKTRMLFQGASSALIGLAETAGVGESAAALLSGSTGLDETHVADDLWLVAHGELNLAAFLARHGYHGPGSGDVASRSWREDHRPVTSLLVSLRNAERPAERRARARTAAAAAAAEVVDRLPASRRAGARLALRFAPVAARNLERSKMAFLIALDMGRAATRAIGDELVAAGALEDRDDGFFLLPGELLAEAPGDLRELVARRRAAHRQHSTLEMPATWTGQPHAVPRVETTGSDRVERLTGAGVSPGTVTGTVRVVIDPSDVDAIAVGEILVAHTTDPSWVSLMTIAGGLVVDIGTAASHSAIVARELGIPCVIGTQTGTVSLHDGDEVQIDGGRGTIDVLSHAVAVD